MKGRKKYIGSKEKKMPTLLLRYKREIRGLSGLRRKQHSQETITEIRGRNI